METTPQIEQHLRASSNIKLHRVMVANLVGGICWGAGSVVGTTIILAIIGVILKLLGVFNIIGDLLKQFGIYIRF